MSEARGYEGRDEITVSPQALGDRYDDMIELFFNEHMHEDEEIRFVRAGSGFFDVRGTASYTPYLYASVYANLYVPASETRALK